MFCLAFDTLLSLLYYSAVAPNGLRVDAVSGAKRHATSHFVRPFVKRFALRYRSLVCLSVSALSVTLVYCGQTVERIKMKLGMRVGLGRGHIVIDGDPAPPPPKGVEPPTFSPCLL